jgi:hypothetical protein
VLSIADEIIIFRFDAYNLCYDIFLCVRACVRARARVCVCVREREREREGGREGEREGGEREGKLGNLHSNHMY